jgi:hypothetical protein
MIEKVWYKENKKERDIDVLGKEKGTLREEKGALGSEKVKYFGTKFESYKVKCFGTEGISGLESKIFISIISASSYPGGKIFFSTKKWKF